MARLPSFIVGGNFSEGLAPTGNALKNTPVTDKPVASKPMGNITGVDKSVAPYRSGVSAADEASSPPPKNGTSSAKSFLDAVEQAVPDMTSGGPIDQSRSPITGRPSPKMGESSAKSFLDAAKQPAPDMTSGGPIDQSRSPITGRPSPKMGDSSAKPFLDAAKQPAPDMTSGGPIDQSRSPVTGRPSPKMGSTAIDMDAAAALFKTTHGSGFDAKSTADKKKMDAIVALMSTLPPDTEMTPNQFAMKIYASQKRTK